MSWKVSEVAALARVTVRTLHHYDRLGLVAPRARSNAGYRLYGPRDLERLQQVLFFRELGFPLREVRRIMTDRRFDRKAALAAQRSLLIKKMDQLRVMVDAVDRALSAAAAGRHDMDAKQMFDGVGGFDPRNYEDEVRRRWGGTDAGQEAARRTAKYTPKQWTDIRAEAAKITGDLAACFDRGTAAADQAAMDVAERHRQHIERWYYPCSHTMHVGLGKMYVADPRFAQNYEQVRPGLAAYMRDAIAANARRA